MGRRIEYSVLIFIRSPIRLPLLGQMNVNMVRMKNRVQKGSLKFGKYLIREAKILILKSFMA